ncbi:Fc.00g009640.m01.CDS01 [Cosmosporella sp. VM-42]
MSDDSTTLNPSAVTLLQDEPFEFVPVIRDILRTRYCVPGTILLVEGIDTVSVSSSGRWQAIRLLLSDGMLCIQALLSGDMHRFVQTGDVALGSYIRCENFQAKCQKIDEGTMVYLVVEDLVTVGWNDSYRALQQPKALESEPQPASAPAAPQRLVPPPEEDDDDAAVEEAFGVFETLAFPLHKPNPPERTRKDPLPASKSQPIALPRDWHDPQTPLKLTTLRSIPHLPYAQNWSCNVLAIITSLSPVEPSNLPPHKQRTARIADPSTSKHVHLTVFLDPEEFSPQIGSAVLLVGVKNHRFDGGSLKKYASDKNEGQWWFENPWELTWCDIDGIKEWWSEMEKATQT